MNEIDYKKFKAGYVAIIGLPNAGKSTLMNALLDIKLSIISAKPQTTRRRVLGIYNAENIQSIFIDTPGMLKPRYSLQSKMMEYVQQALGDADLLILIVDAKDSRHPVEIPFTDLKSINKPVILLINKIDLLPRTDILPLIDLYRNHHPYKEIIPVSALEKDGLDLIKRSLQTHLPNNPPYYPPDVITDQPERFFTAEIIREKIFERFYQEIPYSTEVTIEDFKEREKGKNYIYAVIAVERNSQKGILIGKGGEMLKKIGEAARRDIEEFLGRPVFLDLKVKVNTDWRRDPNKLRQLGY